MIINDADAESDDDVSDGDDDDNDDDVNDGRDFFGCPQGPKFGPFPKGIKVTFFPI